MSLIGQIANNLQSPFVLIQRALGDEQELARVLRAIRSFCIKKGVYIAVYANGRFCAKENKAKTKNPHCEYVVQSLNAVGFQEYFIEVAQYLNNQKVLNSAELASMLNSCLLAQPQKRIIAVLSEAQMRRIDLEIRRRYELNKAQDGMLNWQLFLPSELTSYNELLHYLNIPLRDVNMLSEAEEVLYKFARPLSEKQIILLCISDVCRMLSIPAIQAVSEFHVNYIDYKMTVNDGANYHIHFAEMIAFALLKQKPAFLLVRDKASWALIVVMPESLTDNNKKLVVLQCGITSALQQKFIDEVCSYLMRFVQDRQLSLSLKLVEHINIDCSKTLKASLDVMTALCMSAFIRAYNTLLPTYEQNQLQNISQAINDYIANYDSIATVESFVRARIREFHAQMQLAKPEKNTDWLVGNNNNQMLAMLDDIRINAARVIIQIIANYQPHPLYDVFGYDFSRRRMRLIEEMTDSCKDTEIWQIYGLDLSELKRNKVNNKLYQDLQLGLFLDKIFEDSKLPYNVIAKQIHPILLKIANAGQEEYKRHKQKVIASQASVIAVSRRLQLVRRMFDLLIKQFMQKNFIAKLEEVINNWLTCNHEILHGMQDDQEREALCQEMVQILVEWLFCIQGGSLRNKVNLPTKISLTKITANDLGEFIGTLCYQKACLIYQNESAVNVSTLVYNKYGELLAQLPERAIKIHQEHIESKRRKIQARRLLRVFEDYRILHLRQSHSCKAVFDRALLMLHDPLIYEVLQPSLKNLVAHNEFHGKTWADSPSNLMKSKDFGKFLHAVIKLSGVQKSQLRLNKKMLNTLSLRSNG